MAITDDSFRNFRSETENLLSKYASYSLMNRDVSSISKQITQLADKFFKKLKAHVEDLHYEQNGPQIISLKNNAQLFLWKNTIEDSDYLDENIKQKCIDCLDHFKKYCSSFTRDFIYANIDDADRIYLERIAYGIFIPGPPTREIRLEGDIPPVKFVKPFQVLPRPFYVAGVRPILGRFPPVLPPLGVRTESAGPMSSLSQWMRPVAKTNKIQALFEDQEGAQEDSSPSPKRRKRK